jgi:hypothetical protein
VPLRIARTAGAEGSAKLSEDARVGIFGDHEIAATFWGSRDDLIGDIRHRGGQVSARPAKGPPGPRRRKEKAPVGPSEPRVELLLGKVSLGRYRHIRNHMSSS